MVLLKECSSEGPEQSMLEDKETRVMTSTTIRVGAEIHEALSRLAAKEKVTIQNVVERAVELYQRRKFWEEANAAFARLRQDKKAWKEEREEREAWDVSLKDGLDSGN